MLLSPTVSAPCALRIATHVRSVIHGKDGGVLLDTDKGKCFSVNSVGAEIWSIIEENSTSDLNPSCIAKSFSRFYGIPVEQAEKDVTLFLEELKNRGFLIPATGSPTEASQSSKRSTLIRANDFRDTGPTPAIIPAVPQTDPAPTEKSSIWKLGNSCISFLFLIAADIVLKIGGFRKFYGVVKKFPKRNCKRVDESLTSIICTAVDRATRWYLKPAWCLQRSAVTACMLRFHGIDARLAIGCRKLPFKAHAWVEVNGLVVNDQPKVNMLYKTMDLL